MSRPPAPAVMVALLTCAALLAACGTPPELRDPPPGTVPSPRSTVPSTPSSIPSAAPPVAPTPTPTATAFGELTAVDCAGRPKAAQVIALLRRTGVLPPNAPVTVLSAPVCAGDWQHTEVRMPGREPLQVVTSGAPSALTLVTSGTDVCNIPVRTGAPPGIRAVACDAASPRGVPGT
ncbi:hypothetical protein [Micromonospora sp. NPDC049679]|uniref:hypothetical protein n=1 Tax=Micromonospora sp. NPDC049679 TaxID=3155920 RepID=UPI0033CB06E3